MRSAFVMVTAAALGLAALPAGEGAAQAWSALVQMAGGTTSMQISWIAAGAHATGNATVTGGEACLDPTSCVDLTGLGMDFGAMNDKGEHAWDMPAGCSPCWLVGTITFVTVDAQHDALAGTHHLGAMGQGNGAGLAVGAEPGVPGHLR